MWRWRACRCCEKSGRPSARRLPKSDIFAERHRGGEIRAEFAVLDGRSQMIGVGGWLLNASPVGISSRQA
jgi:hypothetical protein